MDARVGFHVGTEKLEKIQKLRKNEQLGSLTLALALFFSTHTHADTDALLSLSMSENKDIS
eukprot:m.36741 g.36741  ORF g.36741 m.36741 type:complete len:61 (-) comp16080_c0_seq1:210-392(-)